MFLRDVGGDGGSACVTNGLDKAGGARHITARFLPTAGKSCFSRPDELAHLRIRLARHVVLVCAEADPATRRFVGRGDLLEEVVHASFDVLDVVLDGIGATLKAADPLDLFEAVQEHFAQNAGRPLAEACTFDGLYAVADRNNHIEVVIRFGATFLICLQKMQTNRFVSTRILCQVPAKKA